jgi:hypothetical protein
LERKQYTYANSVPPDLVIKLIGDTEKLYIRRSEKISFELIETKQNAVLAVPFGGFTKVIQVDACSIIENITSKIMVEIGKLLNSRAVYGHTT